VESLQNIKRRLKTVKNIGQITKAMELVAATKMRKSQDVALASRPYVYTVLELLAQLSRVEMPYTPPLLKERVIKRTAVVVIASDKGLTGSFNSAVFRACEKYMETKHTNVSSVYIAVGTKSAQFLQRKGYPTEASFTQYGDITTVEGVRPLATMLLNGYLSHKWDSVVILSTNFKSALSQNVVTREVFPITFESLEKTAREIIPVTKRFTEEFNEKGFSFFAQDERTAKDQEYIIEPSPEKALETLIPHLVMMQIYHTILEANASEHASRRMAMKNASDNANDILDTLSIEYNKSRQAGITRELTEITAGAEAL